MKAMLFSILIIASISVFAHEGHDDAPGSVKAFHGGTVKAGKQLNLEVVSAGGELKVFPLGHGGKDIPLSDVQLSATAQAPKGKPFPVKFEQKDGAFYSKLDFKGAYRLTVDMKTIYQGKTDNVKVQVEQ